MEREHDRSLNSMEEHQYHTARGCGLRYIHEAILRKYNLPQLQIQCLAKCLVVNGLSINING
jgi:hypothetical protein